ncbi:MAG: LURP-one-related family protein [Pirellulales bacterium]
MRYLMKEKLFSLGDDFTIKDADGQDRYFVDGAALSIGDRLSLQDMQGNELAQIKQKLLSLGRRYEIVRDGKSVGTVRKELFTFFRDVFDVEDAAAGDLDAVGDFIDHEYRFTRDGQPVATVSKRFFSFSDSYGIDIADGEDDVLILACAVVIDQCSHDD